MQYSSEIYLDLFEATFLESMTPEERFEALRHGNVFRYRAKTYRMGNDLECEIFPVWNTKGEAARAKKMKPSRAAQVNLNHKNTQKKVSRLASNNFTGKDIWATFGYSADNVPPTPEAARRDMQNYIRRLKRYREKQGLPPLRYIYVTEGTDKDGKAVQPHHHIILSGDMDRDFVENEWRGGEYPQARRLRPDDKGLTGLAFYITKGRKGKKYWGYSKNLKMPVPSVADKKITKRQIENLVFDRNTAPEYFKDIFKGYRFRDTERDLEIKQSDHVAGAYIYLRMCKMPPPREEKKKVR